MSDVVTRHVDHRALAIVAQAVKEHFTVKVCQRCNGPEILSKVNPLARCFACGTVRELEHVARAERRWRCDACHSFWFAKFGSKVCPTCKEREQARIQKAVRRTRKVKKPALIPNEYGGVFEAIDRVQGKPLTAQNQADSKEAQL